MSAAELAEQAWRFTVPGDPQRGERLVEAAHLYWRASVYERGIAMLEPEMEAMTGTQWWGRARLTMFRLKRLTIATDPLDDVLVDADPRLRAEVLLEKSDGVSFNIEGGVQNGFEWAGEALRLAGEVADRDLQVRCLVSLTWNEAMLGIDPEPTLAALEQDGPLPDSIQLFDDPDRVRMVRALWRGELANGRDRLDALLASATEQLDDWATVVFTVHLFELAIRMGTGTRWPASMTS